MTRPTDGAEVDAPRARADIVFRSLARDWVIYDPRTKLLHVLNAAGAAVWSCCDGSRSVEDIATELTETLSDAPDPEQVAVDVREALARFAQEGLLE